MSSPGCSIQTPTTMVLTSVAMPADAPVARPVEETAAPAVDDHQEHREEVALSWNHSFMPC